jgi:hypothetical protein
MKTIIFSLALALPWAVASGADFYCSSTSRVQIAQLEDGADASSAASSIRKSARVSKHKVDRFDVLQAYSGQPVLVGSTWLTACLLDPRHPDTQMAFASLIGVNAEAAAAMARGSGLVDRGLSLTRDMAVCLTDNAPAVGYSSISITRQGVKPCF